MIENTRFSTRVLAVAVAAAIVGTTAAGRAPAAGAQATALLAPVTLDGPSAAITELGGLSLARDGSGAAVYLKGGHVWAARLQAGVWQPPDQLDAALSGTSSAPVVAAGNGGTLLVAFLNGGDLYTVTRAGASQGYSTPAALAAGAASPAISISNFGKGYLAFTAPDPGGGRDVRAAHWSSGAWALEQGALNQNAGDSPGAPSVTAAGDGVAVVAWPEGGHVYTRRVWGSAPSVVVEQADPASWGGLAVSSADQPQVAAGGDSSYATVAFRVTLSDGERRVLSARLHGSQYDQVTEADGLSTPGVDAAGSPAIAVDEATRGLVTASITGARQVWAQTLGGAGWGLGSFRVDSLPDNAVPVAVPAIAGLSAKLIAWQHDPGGPGAPEIRLRYAGNGTAFGAEQVMSDPSLGATDAAAGLAAGGDLAGEAAVAWLQGPGGGRLLEAAQLYTPPGPFAPVAPFSYSANGQPVLAWSAPRQLWGPLTYAVSVDGASVGQTTDTSLRVGFALADGRHTWQVTATNAAGLTSTSGSANLLVDTIAPIASMTVDGDGLAGSPQHVYAAYRDPAPPGGDARAPSGTGAVSIDWGDGHRQALIHRATHIYSRSGTYVVLLTVADRAGNSTTVTTVVRIVSPSHRRRRPARITGRRR